MYYLVKFVPFTFAFAFTADALRAAPRNVDQFGDLVYKETGYSSLWSGHAAFIYHEGAIPLVADVTNDRGFHAIQTDRSYANFQTAWTRRPNAYRRGLKSQLKAALKARIDFYNSYYSHYDGNHLNQKGKFFPDGDAFHAGAFWEFDCVGFIERTYEDIGINITSKDKEVGVLGIGWPLTMREQRDGGRTIPPPVQAFAGDFNGDRLSDVAITGGSSFKSIPVAFSSNNGNFNVTNHNLADVPSWATTDRAKALSGDFNGDGLSDFALVGGIGWRSIPVAFSQGNGTFRVTNQGLADFPGWASTLGVQAVAGDFNGDGRTDIAIPGGANFESIPIAYSNGDGTFRVTNNPAPHAKDWGKVNKVKIVTTDLNGDKRSDLVYVGVQNYLPVVLLNPDGSLLPLAYEQKEFPYWAFTVGVKAVTGDFNRDGLGDVALTGGHAWSSIPIAYSNGNGSFTVVNPGVQYFGDWAQAGGAKAYAGDFNGDGYTDVGAIGGDGWTTIPLAHWNGSSYVVTNNPVANFPGWATAL